MNTIQTTISNEPVTGFKRVGKHENFVICADLNMTQQIRVITVDETGQPLTERLQKDSSLTTNQILAGQQRYADQLITRQTEGAFVDITGQVVPEGTPGAIPQRDYFQAITLGDLKKQGMSITDKTPVTALIYAMITGEIGNIDKRGGV